MKNHIGSTFPESLIVEAEALLIGDRSGMDEELAADYRTLGITHLFAISGFHVGLLTFMFRGIVTTSIYEERKRSIRCLMVLLPLYAVMAGGAPSVWRAVSVTILVLLAASGRVKVRLDDALAISAIVFIFYQPFVLFQPGFSCPIWRLVHSFILSAILAKPRKLLLYDLSFM